MPDWVVERGIGESRYARIEDGEIVEARILLDGVIRSGSVLEARLAKVGVPAIAVAKKISSIEARATLGSR